MSRKHVAAAVTVPIVAAVVAVVSHLGGFSYPYRTLPAPRLPAGFVQPSCGGDLSLGNCAPRPKGQGPSPHIAAGASLSLTGPDLSNNDPVYGAGAWQQIAARNRYVWFKLNQGTGFIDRTAAAMAAQAKAAGLAVGGYDFAEVCQVNPISEALTFIGRERALQLTGPGSAPPVLDAEYPTGRLGCDVRAWITAWRRTVLAYLGAHSAIYTGAWWWQPHVGSWWPTDALSWVSGYGVSYPFMPAGRSELDWWQFTDHGYNGASSADLSRWVRDRPSLEAALSSSPPARVRCFGPHAQLNDAHCRLVRPEVSRRSREIVRVRRLLYRYGCWRLVPRDPQPATRTVRGPNHDRGFCKTLFVLGTRDHQYIATNFY